MVMQGRGERFFSENNEGVAEYAMPRVFWKNRPPGLSAMVRLKNEAEWVVPSLDSVVDWCDEVAIFLQGEQTDGTDRLVDEWAAKHPDKAVVHRYPFDSLPNGPGHDRQPRGSLHERAYFYNWCQTKTRFDHVMKWDGDMVAFDSTGPAMRELMALHRIIRFRGIDIVGKDLRYMSSRPFTAREPRIWLVTNQTWWYSGFKCEYFRFGHEDGYGFPTPAYLHFKWAKDFASASKDWPSNWRLSPHFTRIARRATAGREWVGDWPRVLESRRPR